MDGSKSWGVWVPGRLGERRAARAREISRKDGRGTRHSSSKRSDGIVPSRRTSITPLSRGPQFTGRDSFTAPRPSTQRPSHLNRDCLDRPLFILPTTPFFASPRENPPFDRVASLHASNTKKFSLQRCFEKEGTVKRWDD